MVSFTAEYYNNTKDLEPSQLLIEALAFLKAKGKTALDLGCGAGRDTKFLLENGFSVTAIDSEPLAESYISPLQSHGTLTFINTTFKNYSFGKYDIINARYSLPFSPPHSFPDIVSKIINALHSGGIFVGQLFGVNDEWNVPTTNMSFHTREAALDLLSPLEIIKFSEEDQDGLLADGSPKHWHVFHIIARRK